MSSKSYSKKYAFLPFRHIDILIEVHEGGRNCATGAIRQMYFQCRLGLKKTKKQLFLKNCVSTPNSMVSLWQKFPLKCCANSIYYCIIARWLPRQVWFVGFFFSYHKNNSN